MLTKLIVLAIYFAILFAIGILASRQVHKLSDFYVGGKKLGYWLVAFSARVTGESGWLLLGLTGMGAIAGYSAYWVVVGEVLGVALSWFFMAKPFKRLTDQYESITVPDFFESHFDTKTHRLRIIAALTLAIFVIIFVAAQIDITGKAFEDLLGVNYFAGALAGFFIVVAYIFVGGFVAVVWSDLFQGVLMFFGLIILPVVVWYYLPEGTNITQSLQAIDPALTSAWGTSDDPWLNIATLFGFAMIGLGFLGSPQVYVRFISVKNTEEIDKGRWVAILFTLITDSAAVLIGILGRIVFTNAGQDPESILGQGGEEVLVLMVNNFFPNIIIAIYIAIILSAIMSTIDSLLVVGSGSIVRDLYQKVWRPDRSGESLINLSRGITLIMALVALAIALSVAVLSPDRTVFWFAIFGWSGIAATFCPATILALFWKPYSEQGAMASMLTGFLCVPIFKFGVQSIDGVGIYFEKMDVLFPAFVLSMLARWLFSKIYPRIIIPK